MVGSLRGEIKLPANVPKFREGIGRGGLSRPPRFAPLPRGGGSNDSIPRQMTVHPVIERRWFAAGEDIVRQGTAPKALHIIIHGIGCRYQTTSDGARQIIGLLFPGDTCDASQFLLPEMDNGVKAIAHTEVAIFPQQKVSDDAQFTEMLWFTGLRESAILRQFIVNMGQLKALGRMANLIYELYIYCRMFDICEENTFILPLTQKDLADMLGISAVHVNRIITQLTTDNLISLTRRRVTILNHVGLRKIAEFDLEYLFLLHGSHALRLCGIKNDRTERTVRGPSCQWIVDVPPSCTVKVCGEEAVFDSAYCRGHYLRAFIANKVGDGEPNSAERI